MVLGGRRRLGVQSRVLIKLKPDFNNDWYIQVSSPLRFRWATRRRHSPVASSRPYRCFTAGHKGLRNLPALFFGMYLLGLSKRRVLQWERGDGYRLMLFMEKRMEKRKGKGGTFKTEKEDGR